MTERARRASIAPLALLLGVLAACGGGPPDQAALAAQGAAARAPASLQAGDVEISASIAPTAALGPAIAARYGVTPGRDTQLLLVGLRQGPAHAQTSLPARVTARARDLRGVWQDVPLREVRSEGFIDYAGTVRVAPPDTLAFEIAVQREGVDSPDVLRFSRDVVAR